MPVRLVKAFEPGFVYGWDVWGADQPRFRGNGECLDRTCLNLAKDIGRKTHSEVHLVRHQGLNGRPESAVRNVQNVGADLLFEEVKRYVRHAADTRCPCERLAGVVL